MGKVTLLFTPRFFFTSSFDRIQHRAHNVVKSQNGVILEISIQWNLDLRKPDLRKNLNLRKIVGTTDFLVYKLFDLRKIF